MNNNAYVHSEANNNHGMGEEEQNEGTASRTDTSDDGESSSSTAVVSDDRRGNPPSGFSGLVKKSKMMGGRLVGTLKKTGTADPSAAEDDDQIEGGDKGVGVNGSTNEETIGDQPKLGVEKRNRLLHKFGKKKAGYDVQEKEAERSDGPPIKGGGVPGSNKLRQLMSSWGQNKNVNGSNLQTSPDAPDTPSAEAQANTSDPGAVHDETLESQPAPKRQARFPNVNVLFQKYVSKHQSDPSTEEVKAGEGREGDEGDGIIKETSPTKATWRRPLTSGGKRNKLENGNGAVPPAITAAPLRASGRGEDDGGSRTDTMCGGFGWYPDWLQRFATPRQFLLAFCLQNVLQGAAISLFVGTATSVEKHFHFASKDIGSIIMFSEIGPIFTSLALSHLGGRGNRPRWMACGQLLSMLGLLLAFANYLFYPPPEISELADPGGSRKLCRYTDLLKELVVPLHQLQQTSAASLRSIGHTNCFAHNQSAFFSWIMVHTLLGIGNSMVYTIGAPYLDDSIKKKDSPLYFAISISVRILGPLLGFSMTAILLKIYVHPFSNPGLQPSDPRWVGAWWIGCLVLGGLFSVVALLTSIFPRRMRDNPLGPHDNEKSSSYDPEALSEGGEKTNGVVTFDLTQEAEQSDVTVEGRGQAVEVASSGIADTYTVRENLKQLWDTLKRLGRNPVIVYSIAGDFFSMSGALAIFMWLPKYLEHQFRVDKSTSALFSGISGMSSVILGVLGGGMFIKRCHPTARTLTLVIIVCKIVYIVTLVGLMNIHCDFNDDLPGVVTMDGESLELYRGCSGGCECSKQEFIPVCVTDGPLKVTFFSPCHAGCYTPNAGDPGGSERLVPLNSDGTELEAALPGPDDGVTFYRNCSCGSPNAEVRSGYCRHTCFGFTLFNMIQATVNSFVSIGTIGGVLITLRCVSAEDKAPSLGLKSSVLSLAMLLNPVIFGSLTDSSCLVWEEACGQTGACWVYNARDLGYKIFTSAIILFSISTVLEYFVYRNVKSVKLFDDDQVQRSPSSRTLSSVFGSRIANRFSSRQPASEEAENKAPPSALKNTFKKLSLSSVLSHKVFRGPKSGPTAVKPEDTLNASTDTLKEDRESTGGHTEDDLQDVVLREAVETRQGYDNQAADIEALEDRTPAKDSRAKDNPKVVNASDEDFKIED